MSVGIQTRIEWLRKRLIAKHPTYTQKAIQFLAETILSVEDTDSTDEEDELDYNRRIEQERIKDIEFEAQEERLRQEIEAQSEQEKNERIKTLANSVSTTIVFHNKATRKPTDFSGINERNHLGQTLLHKAVLNQDLKRCKELVEKKGINPRIRDNRNNTAYALAVREGYVVIANYLLNKT